MKGAFETGVSVLKNRMEVRQFAQMGGWAAAGALSIPETAPTRPGETGCALVPRQMVVFCFVSLLLFLVPGSWGFFR